MSDFDPQDIIKPEQESLLAKKKAVSDFDPQDVIQPVSASSDFDPKDVIQDVTKLESGLRGVAQGAAMGFADELTGGAEALVKKAQGSQEPLGKLYETSRDESRANYKKAHEANPKTYLGGEITGTLGTFLVPGLNAAAGAKLATVAGKAALQGAIAGAGNTEASLTSGEGVKDVAQGAAIGGVLGGTLHGAIKGGAAVLNKFSSKATPAEQALIRESKLSQIDIDTAAQKSAQETAQADTIIANSLKTKSEPSAEEFTRIADEYMPDRVRDTLAKSRNAEEEMAKYGKGVWENRVSDFTESLAGEKPANAQDALEMLHTSQLGEGGTDNLMRKFGTFMEEQHAERAIQNGELQVHNAAPFSTRALNTVSNVEPVLRSIDDTAGSHLELLNNELNTRMIHKQLVKSALEVDINKSLRKLGNVIYTPESQLRINQALRAQDLSKLTAEETQAAQYLKSQFEKVMNIGNGLEETVGKTKVKLADGVNPLSITKLEGEGYLPNMTKSPEEIISTVQSLEKQALQEAGDAVGRPLKSFAELSKDEFSQVKSSPLMQQLAWPLEKEASTGMGLQNALNSLYSREGRVGLISKAKSAMQRTGEIPEAFKENNPFQLLARYTEDVLNHVYMRDPLDKMASAARSLRKAKYDYGADYIENLIKDVRGTRQNTFSSESKQLQIKANLALDKKADAVGRDTPAGQAILSAKKFPAFMSDVTQQIYPNMMGWNIRNFMQNSLQTFTKTIPEMGPMYGSGNAIKSLTKVALNRSYYLEKANKMGVIAPQFTESMQREMELGIKSSLPWRATKAAVKKLGDLSMSMMQFSETTNRAVAVAMSEQMAKDLASGSSLATKALYNNFPPSLQKVLTQDLGNVEQNTKILSKYLVAQTQYFYSKASMFEAGRVMGPMFTPFTKWPTATFGDVMYEIRSRSLGDAGKRLLAKYFLPAMMLEGIQRTIFGDPKEGSDFDKKVVGTKGLRSAAPMDTLGSMGSSLGTPVVPKAVFQDVVLPAFRGDTDKMSQGMGKVMSTFTPGYGTYRFFTEDIPIYINRIERGK